MTAPSAKPLFRAISGQSRTPEDSAQMLIGDLPVQRKPDQGRDALDYDPTPRDATAAFLAAEGDRMREIGGPVWEPAVGGGHMAAELLDHGFDVIGSDVVDRNWPDTVVRSFYDFDAPLSDIIVTNPPYCEVSARDGHGRWLKHIEGLGVRYAAMLLSAEWMFGRINGMDALHDRFPVSREYKCCWKIDFRGQGRPAQRNVWLVWDRDWQGETVTRRLFRAVPDKSQGKLI